MCTLGTLFIINNTSESEHGPHCSRASASIRRSRLINQHMNGGAVRRALVGRFMRAVNAGVKSSMREIRRRTRVPTPTTQGNDKAAAAASAKQQSTTAFDTRLFESRPGRLRTRGRPGRYTGLLHRCNRLCNASDEMTRSSTTKPDPNIPPPFKLSAQRNETVFVSVSFRCATVKH